MLSEHRQAVANGRIGAFLASQRGLMTYYAAEGRAASATWLNADAGDPHPGSPMLVPRAVVAKDDELRTMACSATSDESGASSPIDIDGPSSSISHPHIEPNPDSPSKATRVIPVELVPAQCKSTDRGHSPDDESERLLRLAQRRNRRLARRSAMKAAEDSVDSEAEPSEKDASRPKKKRQKIQVTDKKQKKNRVTPALLLMQKFSAQNLGKSRLTIRPSTTVGVFNKGKASGKVVTKSKRTGKFTPDIVFSESKFLKKAPSARSESESLKDDSDGWDNHSIYSLMDPVNRQKTQTSMHDKLPRGKPAVSDRNDCGSPARSSRSVREDSPPWDIEEEASPSPSPVRSVAHPCNHLSPLPPPRREDITIGVEQCSWTSKLCEQEPHIPTLQNRNEIKPVFGPHNLQPHLTRPPTTSAYFIKTNVPTEPQVQFVPSSRLDAPVVRLPIHETICYPTAPPGPDNSPSTPECLQLEHARVISGLNDAYKNTSEIRSSWTDSMILPSCSPMAGLRDVDSHSGWCLEEAEDTTDMWTPNASGDNWNAVSLDECAWNNHYYTQDQHDSYFEDFLVQGEAVHKTHTALDYADVPHEASGAERLYESAGEVSYFYSEDENTGDEYFEGVDEGLPDYHLDYHLQTVHDNRLCLHQTTNVDDVAVVQPTPLLSDFEFDEPVVGGEVIKDEGAEQAPCLVRIVTEASLRDDLLKSMNSHWNVAHRLY